MRKVPQNNKGFVKGLTLIVLAICVLFIVFIVFAQYVGPQAKNLTGLATGGGTSATGVGTTGTNPLLKFLDNSSGNYDSSSFSSGGGLDNIPASARSRYAGKISLGAGAPYSTQPNDEYVTLRNSGSNSINITGWTLTNGKGTRPIQTSENNYIYPVADSAVIGQGTELLDPSGRFDISSIIMKPGDSAIVTTGVPYAQFPFSITTSFRENICEGYLKNYPFEPSLNQSCPNPTSDPLIRTVTDECYDYMSSLNRCEDPEKYDKTNFDAETTQCRNFMTQRLNYPACVSNNHNVSGFLLGQWRIFLGKSRELWAIQKETITLYDSLGLIVDQISY
jgi:hypothetical protein